MRGLQLECASLQGESAAALKAEMEIHRGLLDSFVAVKEHGEKYLGFQISYGFIRTLAITLFTLSVGLWSVFQGTGIVLTLEVVCGPMKS